jgi:hypothetical protein
MRFRIGSALQWAAAKPARRALAGVVLRAVAPLLPRKPPPPDPIFIVGSPRSGTSLLFYILNRSSRVASLNHESHLLWNMFHSLEDSPTRSHEVSPESITSKERRVLYWAIDRLAEDRRYLDKFPRNSLRVPHLHALFPGAWFVYVKRDGRATVSSIMTGWRTRRRFDSEEKLPVNLSIRGYEGATWSFLLPPGWEKYATGRSLEEVAAFQWTAANRAILDAKESIGTSRWAEVKYEQLVDAPAETVAWLLDRLGLPAEEAVLTWASEIEQHVVKSAVTAPRQGKWREENPAEIQRILPQILPMMEALGYDAIDGM